MPIVHEPRVVESFDVPDNGLARQACLRFAHLVCRIDMMDPKSKFIPLGIIVEVNVTRLRGYGLLTRECLSPTERELIGPMMAKVLSNPSKLWGDSIRPIFEQMRTNAALRGQLIAELSHNPMTSITSANAQFMKIPKEWMDASAKAIEADVSLQLRDIANVQMDALMRSCGLISSEFMELTEYEFRKAAKNPFC
jgi:hypothetical protein